MKTFFLIIISFFIVGCTGKQLTVKSLHPSSISDRKIYDIIIEDFQRDNINQTNYIEEKLVNKTINGKRVFNLNSTYDNIDAIITGKVLESSLFYDIYYEKDIDYNRCKEYKYKDGKKTKKCIRYKKRKIPCERRDYKVRTQIQILDEHEYLLFSKIYTKTKTINQCFRNRNHYYPYYVDNYTLNRQKHNINSQLALQIANEAIKDLSPHYSYQNITIIEKLDENNPIYTQAIKQEFEYIVELLDNGNISIAQERLDKLDYKLRGKSYEVLYNLALTYEASNTLHTAKSLYKEASKECKNIDDLKIIDSAIRRVSSNIKNKEKASFQLN